MQTNKKPDSSLIILGLILMFFAILFAYTNFILDNLYHKVFTVFLFSLTSIVLAIISIAQKANKKISIITLLLFLFILFNPQIYQFLTKGAIAQCDIMEKDIGYPYDKSVCYYTIATEKNDPKICEKIVEEGWRSNCYFFIAKERGDLGLCSKIPLSEIYITKAKCYEYFAGEDLDLNSCNKIEDKNSRDICYNDIAWFKENPRPRYLWET